MFAPIRLYAEHHGSLYARVQVIANGTNPIACVITSYEYDRKPVVSLSFRLLTV
jgi:hypothetical protein